MSQTSTGASTKYNSSNVDERTTQLRAVHVEEGKIAELAKVRFESLSSDIQGKLNSAPQ
jgi:hypothetical protein